MRQKKPYIYNCNICCLCVCAWKLSMEEKGRLNLKQRTNGRLTILLCMLFRKRLQTKTHIKQNIIMSLVIQSVTFFWEWLSNPFQGWLVDLRPGLPVVLVPVPSARRVWLVLLLHWHVHGPTTSHLKDPTQKVFWCANVGSNAFGGFRRRNKKHRVLGELVLGIVRVKLLG